MGYIPGFLQVNDPVNGCVTLLDNSSTSVMSRRFTRWFTNDCPECHCPAASCGYTEPSEAPWYSPGIPGSAEFLGLYGALKISQPSASVIVTQTGSTSVAPLKQLVFEGVLVGTTTRGVAYGSNWFQNQLEPLCRSCDGRTATVFKWCPDELCDPPPDPTDPNAPAPVTPVYYDLNTVVGIDGCTVPEGLPAAPPIQYPVDTGERTLTKVSYIPGSFADVDDNDELPGCYGRRVTFAFTIDTGESLTSPESITIMQPPVLHPCCVDLGWVYDDDLVDCGCAARCECVQPVKENDYSPAVNPLPDGAAECQYSTPLCARQYAMLIGPVASQNGVPVIEIKAGNEPLENVSVTIWQAATGLPSPSTPAGADFYSGRDPVVDPALIPYIAPNSTLVLDGGDQSEYMRCPGTGIEAADVTRCGPRSYQHPSFCCGNRYWVVVEMPCDEDGGSPTGWTVTTTVLGVEGI